MRRLPSRSSTFDATKRSVVRRSPAGPRRIRHPGCGRVHRPCRRHRVSLSLDLAMLATPPATPRPGRTSRCLRPRLVTVRDADRRGDASWRRSWSAAGLDARRLHLEIPEAAVGAGRTWPGPRSTHFAALGLSLVLDAPGLGAQRRRPPATTSSFDELRFPLPADPPPVPARAMLGAVARAPVPRLPRHRGRRGGGRLAGGRAARRRVCTGSRVGATGPRADPARLGPGLTSGASPKGCPRRRKPTRKVSARGWLGTFAGGVGAGFSTRSTAPAIATRSAAPHSTSSGS